MRQLLDAWLIWGVNGLEDTSRVSSGNNRAPGSYEELLAVRSLGDKITAEVQKYGTIVYDINADTARRICMCILWVHGGQENSDYLDNEFRQRWIIHQNEIVDALDGIAGIVGYENMMLFPEGDAAENDAEQQDFRSRKYASPTITKELGEIYASRPDLALLYCQAIINGGNPSEFRETISADNRFAFFGRQHGLDPVTQIHGLSSKEKRVMMNDIEKQRETVDQEIQNRLRKFGIMSSFEDLYRKRAELRKRWYVVNFSHTHQTATESVHEFLPREELGVILLGAAHSRCYEKYRTLAEEVDMFQEPEGMYIEDFFEGDENHRNTRFISFKPHSLVPFEEDDRSDYQKRVDKERAKKADLEARRREWRNQQGFNF